MIDRGTQLLLFENVKRDGFILWVKLPLYHVQWMMSHYGWPCIIPFNNHLGWVLRRGMVRNEERRPLTPMSMSDRMMLQTQCDLPQEEQLQYVAVAMPMTVINGGKLWHVDSSWQLTRQGAMEFREEVRRQFWGDLTEYIRNSNYHAAAQRTYVMLDDQMDDWMEQSGIDIALHDTIKRQYYREIVNKDAEIQKVAQETQFRLRETREQIVERLYKYLRSGRFQYKYLLKKMKK